ncbi:unnamed protein product, partial [Effrenium voratum]
MKRDVASCTAALEQLVRGRGRLPAPLQAALRAQLPLAPAAQLARQAWALGALGALGARKDKESTEPLRELLKLLLRRLESSPQPAAVAAGAWAAARLRLQLPTSAAEVLPRMQPKEASITLWAAAKLRSPIFQSQLRRGRWPARDASMALWAFATAKVRPDAGLLETWCAAEGASEQDISNTLWALATLEISTAASWRYVKEAPLERLRGQAAVNAMWALAHLGQPERLEVLAASASRAQLKPQEWSNGLWALATAGIHQTDFFDKAKDQLNSEALEDLASRSPSGTLLSNVAWSFAFARALLGRQADDEELLAALRCQLRELGAKVDAQTPLEVPVSSPSNDSEQPRVRRRVSGLAVIYKPPGWEVDGKETKDSGAFRLSDFVRMALPSRTVGSSECGFVHRLDVQSSGLVIHAETFEALLDLRWQQDTLRLSREYLVLVHGDFTEPVAGGVRDVRCLEDRLLEVPGGTRVAPNGRPCRCSVRPLARLQAEGKGKEGGEGEKKGKATVPFTLVAVSILTGRRHQIRVQLASRGHPVVGDPRYGNAADLGWCPRLFLHRHRLVFNEGVSVDDPLPADLRAVIANLQPCIELEELEGILAAPPTFDSD